MTGTPIDDPDKTVAPSAPSTLTTQAPDSSGVAVRPPSVPSAHSVLEKLFGFYPHLFGARFLPLKLGVFQELLARHPEDFQRDALKAALGVHTRSTRYLQCVAAGNQRHDLAGTAIEDVAPEHVSMALLELFRRRQPRSKEDLRPRLRAQLMEVFETSGLTRQDYLTRLQTRDADANTLLEEAFAERDQRVARQEALLRAFDASGKTVAEFCDMYGMDPREVGAVLARRDSAPMRTKVSA